MLRSVFVYGSLKEGEVRGDIWDKTIGPQRYKRFPATAQGLLYDLGPFPAMSHGQGTIHGELVVFAHPDMMEDILFTLDAIEGYSGRPNHPGDLYVREIIKVNVGGQEVEAYAYLFNDEILLRFHGTQIKTGTWTGKCTRVARPSWPES